MTIHEAPPSGQFPQPAERDHLGTPWENDWHEVAGRLLTHLDEDTTDSLDGTFAVAIDNYLDPRRSEAREVDVLFRSSPVVAALTAHLPNPGSYRAIDIAGVPVLTVRQGDGGVRAFINACRHRGALVVADGCGQARRFTCPYHAWSYDDEGAPRRDLRSPEVRRRRHRDPRVDRTALRGAQRHDLRRAPTRRRARPRCMAGELRRRPRLTRARRHGTARRAITRRTQLEDRVRRLRRRLPPRHPPSRHTRCRRDGQCHDLGRVGPAPTCRLRPAGHTRTPRHPLGRVGCREVRRLRAHGVPARVGRRQRWPRRRWSAS